MKINNNNIRILLTKETYTEKELTYLRKLLSYCNTIYYNTGEESPLSDFDYDTLLKKYNQQAKESLTTLTPAKTGKKLVNVSHDYPELVGTLDKITNKQELQDWLKVKWKELKLTSKDVVNMIYSNKEDGNSLCITFDKEGNVKSALTRGKEGQGADMTELFKDLKLKLPIKKKFEFGVKFEAVMTYENFDKYNEEYEKLNGKSLSSSRSAVAGILNSDVGYKFINYVSLVPLTVKIKDSDLNKVEQIKIMDLFLRQSPMILPYNGYLVSGTIKDIYREISNYYDKMSKERIELNKPIDGIVIEFADTQYKKQLGRQDDRNNFDVALKFPPLAKSTRIVDINFYYGKSSVITPVAVFEEVEFNGAKCKNVSLANYKRFKELNLSKGDYVNITYNHDVLCYLHLDPTKKQLNNPIPFITKCPICHEELKVNDNETFVSCINPECEGRKAGRIENYMTKIGLKGIKENTIERLLQARLIHEIYDIYDISITDIIGMQGFQYKSAENIYNTIHSKMELKSYELLGSLQINQFSIKSAKEIMKYYTLEELLELHRTKTKFLKEISSLHGFKDITANHIYEGIKENKKTIKELCKRLTIIDTKLDLSNIDNDSLYKFVFTGFRDKELQAKLEEKGHSVTSSVSKNTNYLVVKDVNSTSSKIKKAKDLGINVISIEEAYTFV